MLHENQIVRSTEKSLGLYVGQIVYNREHGTPRKIHEIEGKMCLLSHKKDIAKRGCWQMAETVLANYRVKNPISSDYIYQES